MKTLIPALAAAAVLGMAGAAFAKDLHLPQIGGSTSGSGHLPQITTSGHGGETPRATLSAFIAAMEARNDDPNLAIYSAASRLLLRKVKATDAQMQMVVETYYRCGIAESFERKGVAVERYPVEARQCPPVLMFRENNAWVLDLVTSAGVIRFNDQNEWHFSDGIPKGYAFAFGDWQVDDNGFPSQRMPGTEPSADPVADSGTY